VEYSAAGDPVLSVPDPGFKHFATLTCEPSVHSIMDGVAQATVAAQPLRPAARGAAEKLACAGRFLTPPLVAASLANGGLSAGARAHRTCASQTGRSIRDSAWEFAKCTQAVVAPQGRWLV
jgi:hypothetical protein